jgi:ferredoxin-NADP reductase
MLSVAAKPSSISMNAAELQGEEIVAGFKSVLADRREIAEGTMAFYFERPAGFEFKPGQSIDLTLVNPPETDAEGNTRAFSIASAPSGPDLMIATRMRDTAFKRVLRKMPLQTEVEIEGPSGSFTLHRNSAKAAVFLAGGIGITPFLSIVQQATRDKLPHQLYLFYSNRRPEDAPFIALLQDLTEQNPNFHFIPTMTQMKDSQKEWSGEKGFIDRDMIAKHVSALQGPIYYLAGPPAMVTAMRQALASAGIDEDDLRSEEFSGY